MGYLSENVKSFVKILLAMYAVTAVLLLLLALLVQKFSLEDGAVSVGISVVYVISTFLGGFLAGKVQKTKKFIWGILMGLFYVIVMLGATLAVKGGFHGEMSDFIGNLVLAAAGGMIGGMVS